MKNTTRRTGAILSVAVVLALLAGAISAPVSGQGAATTVGPEFDQIPGKSRGRAVQEVLNGPANRCSDFKNDYTIVPGSEPGTSELRRKFGSGAVDVQDQVFFDPTNQIVVFADDSDQFDSLTILGLDDGSTRPSGFLLEGANDSIDRGSLLDRFEQFSFQEIDTWNNGNWRDQVRPIAEEHARTATNGCSWTSQLRPDKKSRRQLAELLAWLAPSSAAVETPDDTALALPDDDRFQVDIDWASGFSDGAVLTPEGSDWTGITFIDPDSSYEVLVAILDRCEFTDTFWVFAAATTNVEYTLTVTDTQSGLSKAYENELGQPSPAVTDTSAFATCP